MTHTWFAASDVVDAAVAHAPRRHAVIYVDPAVLGSEVDGQVRGWLARHGIPARELTVVPVAPTTDATPEDTHPIEPYRPAEDAAVTAVLGGGAVLDRVKLATMRGLDLERMARTRSNLSVLTPEVIRPVPLVAVPTTLGTGAEASAVAVTGHERRRLVMGRALRPAAYGHAPQAYHSLPAQLVREGLVEILSRLVGPFVGDRAGAPLADTVCRGALRRLVRRGDEIVGALSLGAPGPLDALAEVAAIGALSHGDPVQRPHSPWGVRLWALANELGAATATPKIPATVTLWPAFWAHLDAGDAWLGDRHRLRIVWADIRATHDRPLPADPGPGIAELLAHWGVSGLGPAHRGAVTPEVLTERIRLGWGSGLPMLGGVPADQLRGLLEAALCGPSGLPSGRPGDPVTSTAVGTAVSTAVGTAVSTTGHLPVRALAPV